MCLASGRRADLASERCVPKTGEAQRKVILPPRLGSPSTGPADGLCPSVRPSVSPSVVTLVSSGFQPKGRNGLAIAEAPRWADTESQERTALAFLRRGFPGG